MANWSDYYTPNKLWGGIKLIPRTKKIIVTPINWPTNNPLLKIKEDYKVELMKEELIKPTLKPKPNLFADMNPKTKNKPEKIREKVGFDDFWPDDWMDWFPSK